MPYPQRIIGGDRVSAQGLGCANLPFGQSAVDDRSSADILTRAADLGITFWDISDAIQQSANEKLIGKWFKDTGRRNEVFISTKFGNLQQSGKWIVRGDAAYVKEACAASQKRLGLDVIDLYYQHRVDPKIPIEETVGAMADLKRDGKIRYIGLSKCSAQTLRRAHAVHPIAAVQMEFSPFALEIESNQTAFLKTARDLGIMVVAYSPLGRGLIANSIKSREDFHPNEYRVNHPRFSEELFAENMKLISTLSEMAKEKGVKLAQLVLAWVMAQGDDVIPIPATKRITHLEENAAAVGVMLSDTEMADMRRHIEKAIQKLGGVKDSRIPPAIMDRCFAETPQLLTDD
jgi:aryl-alcohol dehydrogenase-like predicted oxidoreductase